MRRWRAVVFLYALSVSITWAQAWPDQMTVAQGAKDGAKDAALIVAIENYEHVSGVTGARRNAAAWKAWLEQTRGVPYVKVLLDSQAKHGWKRGGKAGGILADVEQMARKVKKGGMLWFVFIGHGAPGEGGEGGLLLGADVEQTVESFEMRGLPVKSELLPRLRKAPQAVAILDACFSGLDGGGRRFIKDLQPVLHAKLNSVPGNVIVLTAAKSDQFAGPLPGASRPAFSYLALGALRGWADSTGQGVITAGDVRRYVEDTLMVSLTDRVQQPDLNGDARVILARGATERRPSVERAVEAPQGLNLMPDVPRASGDYAAIMAAATEADRLKARLAELKRQEEAERAARSRVFYVKLDEEWAQVRPIIQRGDQHGERALVTFLSRWAGKEFPNRYADEARALLERAARQQSAQTQAQSFAGAWRGTYTCRQGNTGLSLKIEVSSSELRAIFKFYPTSTNAEAKSGAFSMTGRVLSDGSFKLAPERWIDHPSNYEMVGMEGRLDVHQQRLSGKIITPGCSTFDLRR